MPHRRPSLTESREWVCVVGGGMFAGLLAFLGWIFKESPSSTLDNYPFLFIGFVGFIIFLSGLMILLSFFAPKVSLEFKFNLELTGSIAFFGAWAGVDILMLHSFPSSVLAICVFLGLTFAAASRALRLLKIQKLILREHSK